MQPNTYFIIFRKKTSKKFGPKPLFRAGPIPAWPICSNRLPAWAPDPKSWAGEEALTRRPARSVRPGFWSDSVGRAHQGSKLPVGRPPRNPSFISFPSPSLLFPNGSGRRRDGDGGAGRRPQQREAMAPTRAARLSCVPPFAGAHPRRAPLDGALWRRARVKAHGGGSSHARRHPQATVRMERSGAEPVR